MLARNPDNVETRVYLAATLVADGNLFAAEWEADEIRAHEAGFSMRSLARDLPLDQYTPQRKAVEAPRGSGVVGKVCFRRRFC